MGHEYFLWAHTRVVFSINSSVLPVPLVPVKDIIPCPFHLEDLFSTWQVEPIALDPPCKPSHLNQTPINETSQILNKTNRYTELTITPVDKEKKIWMEGYAHSRSKASVPLCLSLCVSLSFRIAAVWMLAMGLRISARHFFPPQDFH